MPTEENTKVKQPTTPIEALRIALWRLDRIHEAAAKAGVQEASPEAFQAIQALRTDLARFEADKPVADPGTFDAARGLIIRQAGYAFELIDRETGEGGGTLVVVVGNEDAPLRIDRDGGSYQGFQRNAQRQAEQFGCDVRPLTLEQYEATLEPAADRDECGYDEADSEHFFGDEEDEL